MTSLLSLPRSDFDAPREGEDIEKRGFAPLRHPGFSFVPVFAEGVLDKGISYNLT